METTSPCGKCLNGLKIRVWTVRFCPWAPRRTKQHRNAVRHAAAAIARGRLSLRQARRLFGVARLIGGAQ